MKDRQLSLQLLGMKQEDCYAVVALGMDIWGYGETAQSATDDLQAHMRMQIAYLIHAKKVELIHRKARPEYFDMYDECVVASIKGERVPGWWISTLSIPLVGDRNTSSDVAAGQAINSPSARYAAGVCHRIAA